jgi:hypothetical protein
MAPSFASWCCCFSLNSLRVNSSIESSLPAIPIMTGV